MIMIEDIKADDVSRATCIGIIVDGNRRWAKEHGLLSFEGHAAGLAKAKEIVPHAFSRGVETIILYAFSTENWNRSQEEIEYLMHLFGGALIRELEEFSRENTRIRFIGDLARLPEKLRTSIKKVEEETSSFDSKKTLVLAISYGGRTEILSAVNQLLNEGKKNVREEDISEAVWGAGIQDPDLIIRTGGEKRLSNFLPWQSVYSELFFTDTKWPDFKKEEFDTILAEFSIRERRHGK